jgi:hypothetical protein
MDNQINELAKNIADSIRAFYDDPDNQKAYLEWHLKRYGCLPGEKEDV